MEAFHRWFPTGSEAGNDPQGVVGANGRVFDPADAAIATANSPLARQLKGRHLQMIAIGGSIGERFIGRRREHSRLTDS